MAKVRVSIALMLVAPLMTFVAILLVRNGLVSLEFGLDVLTLRVAQAFAFGAVFLALGSLVLSLGQFRRLGAITLSVLAISTAIAGVFVKQSRDLGVAAPRDVSTDLGDVPAIAGVNSATPQTCDGVVALPTQVAAEQATQALTVAGFAVTEAALFRVAAVRDGFWFGLQHDAVVRIRPGRTDVRVVARYDRKDGGATCRLARQVVAGLQAGR